MLQRLLVVRTRKLWFAVPMVLCSTLRLVLGMANGVRVLTRVLIRHGLAVVPPVLLTRWVKWTPLLIFLRNLPTLPPWLAALK